MKNTEYIVKHSGKISSFFLPFGIISCNSTNEPTAIPTWVIVLLAGIGLILFELIRYYIRRSLRKSNSKRNFISKRKRQK